MPERRALIEEFLQSTGWAEAQITALPGDASSRRYFRLEDGTRSALLMDAPGRDDFDPYTQTAKLAGSSPQAFVCLATELTRRGFSAPRILEADFANNLIILEDFGRDLYSTVLTRHPEREAELYEAAIDTLAALYRSTLPITACARGENWQIGRYDSPALQAEADLFVDWYLPEYGAPIEERAMSDWHAIWTKLYQHLDAQPDGLALRDYHADNLFWLEARDGPARVGLIDFQDALFVHPAYDLVSLIEDARRDVSPDLAPELISRFFDKAGLSDKAGFETAYAVLGAQRNAKILGIFVRLARRDGKLSYLEKIPRVEAHFRRDLAHPALEELRAWCLETVPSLFAEPE